MAPRHRTPLPGNRGRHPDPATSDDPRIRRLLTQLGTLPAGDSHAPGAQFRDELRQQLVAVTPRLITQAAAEAAAGPGTQQRTPGRAASKFLGVRSAAARRIVHLRKPIAAVLGTVALFAMLLVGAVWLSGRAVPGDSLYSLKRASENVQLSMTTGDAARGRAYLALASTRSTEVAELVPPAAGLGSGPVTVSSRTAGLVSSTLDDHDTDVRDASQLLGADAVTTRSPAPLDSLIAWAPGQLSRLDGITKNIPPGALHDRAATSVQLVQQALDRARQLDAVLTLACLASSGSDGLGPRPVTSCPAPPVSGGRSYRSTPIGRAPSGTRPPTAPPHTTSQPGATPAGPPPATASGNPSEGPSGVTTQSGAGSSAAPTTGTASPGPTSRPSPSTSGCGVAINSPLGLPVGIDIGSCGISIGVGGPG